MDSDRIETEEGREIKKGTMVVVFMMPISATRTCSVYNKVLILKYVFFNFESSYESGPDRLE
jgi:hypothetical protein